MILSRLSKKERYLLYITITVCVFVLFDRIALTPITKNIYKLNKEIIFEEKELIKSMRILSQADFIKSQNEKYTKYIRQVSSDEEEVRKLLSEIEKLAKENSVTLVDIKPGKIEKEAVYKRYIIEIEAESKIGNLIDFIYQLEDSPRLLRLSDFYLAPREKNSAVLKAV